MQCCQGDKLFTDDDCIEWGESNPDYRNTAMKIHCSANETNAFTEDCYQFCQQNRKNVNFN